MSVPDRDRVRREFDDFASLADEGGSDRYDTFLARLVPAGARDVLDVGCGSGRLSAALASAGARVVGIDLSPKMIERARFRFSAVRGLSFVCADFLEHDFGDARFDCIASAAMLHHVAADPAIDRMKGLLSPGGRLIIHDVRADSGLPEKVRSSLAFLPFALRRALRTRRLRASPDVRAAWRRHGSGECYLTAAEARQLASRVLPGARVVGHPLWRYTIVWDDDRKASHAPLTKDRYSST